MTTAERSRPAAGRRRSVAGDAVLDPAMMLRMYRAMALARALDDRIWKLSRQGAVPFAVTGRGQEAAQAGLGAALRPGRDYVYPYYRDLALVLTLGMTAEEVMLAAYGRRADPNSAGRQMPNHFSRRDLRIVSGSSPVGTQIPQAAGTALACRLRGEDAAVVATFGEGASSQGDFHEGCNFAAIHRLPVVFVCENNGWAISVPERLQVAPPGIAARAAAYGMHGEAVDGGDPLATYAAAAAALARARAGEGPSLLELRVVRLDPHTSSDDDSTYRPAEERASLAAADPLPRFRRRLLELGAVSEAALGGLEAEVAADVDAATAAAESGAPPDPADLWTGILADVPEGEPAPWAG
jgi:2-oxoisovalerate dehydrogenase E1 component alpha subunit